MCCSVATFKQKMCGKLGSRLLQPSVDVTGTGGILAFQECIKRHRYGVANSSGRGVRQLLGGETTRQLQLLRRGF